MDVSMAVNPNPHLPAPTTAVPAPYQPGQAASSSAPAARGAVRTLSPGSSQTQQQQSSADRRRLHQLAIEELKTINKDVSYSHKQWDEDERKMSGKLKELQAVEEYRVVQVVDWPPHTVLSTRWAGRQRLDGTWKMRIVARGFEQWLSGDEDFFAGTHRLAALRTMLTVAAITGNPVAFGDCHAAFYQSPMPKDAPDVFVRPPPEAEVPEGKCWKCLQAFQGLKASPKAWGDHSTEVLVREHQYRQLISDSAVYSKTGTQGKASDATLLRHMDDIGATGPEEAL